MKIAVVGSGPIALGCAALLVRGGHEIRVWSPRGSLASAEETSLRIVTRGLIESDVNVMLARSAAQAAESDVLILCTRANAHRSVIDAIGPHLQTRHTFIISSHASLSALYLSKLLARRHVQASILALPTTVTSGPMRDGEVHIKTMRRAIEVASVPASGLAKGLDLLRSLFGDVFTGGGGLLSVTLGNVNPQVHMANALLNFTRMENGETWDNFAGISPCVARLLEALDEERLALASAFGVRASTLRDHFARSYSGLQPARTVYEAVHEIASRRAGTAPGPSTIESRWLTEDLPFGVACTIELARVARVPTPVHQAALAVLTAATGHDYVGENDLLPELKLRGMSVVRLEALARDGWPAEHTDEDAASTEKSPR